MPDQQDPFVRVTISLPPEALAKLDRLARAVRRTRSNTVLTFIAKI